MNSTRAIFALDPGGQSGMAWGIFPLNGSVSDAITGRLFSGSDTIGGDERGQIRLIARVWRDFYNECVNDHCMSPKAVEFVCEDFVPRLDGKTGKEITIPERIQMGVEGYRMGRADQFATGRRRGKEVYCPPMILQMPSHARVPSQRLKDWGVWIKGREHERSAWMHLAYRLGTILRQV